MYPAMAGSVNQDETRGAADEGRVGVFVRLTHPALHGGQSDTHLAATWQRNSYYFVVSGIPATRNTGQVEVVRVAAGQRFLLFSSPHFGVMRARAYNNLVLLHIYSIYIREGLVFDFLSSFFFLLLMMKPRRVFVKTV